jgi:hypothetical protein
MSSVPASQAPRAERGVPVSATVTLDAIQRHKTFDAARQTGVGMLVQVKSNQPIQRQTIVELSTVTAPLNSHHSRYKGRNRDETRTRRRLRPRRQA